MIAGGKLHSLVSTLLVIKYTVIFLLKVFPAVYTSYDYGAAISESRLMTPKAYEIKLQGKENIFITTIKKLYNHPRKSLADLCSISSNFP
jgi:hypothetical protein